MTSLVYAARVKLITNSANKNQDSEEVAKLRAIIKALKVRGGSKESGLELSLGLGPGYGSPYTRALA